MKKATLFILILLFKISIYSQENLSFTNLKIGCLSIRCLPKAEIMQNNNCIFLKILYQSIRYLTKNSEKHNFNFPDDLKNFRYLSR